MASNDLRLAHYYATLDDIGIRDAVSLLQARLPHVHEARHVIDEAVAVGPVEAVDRLRIGPRAVEQQDEPVMEQVGECAEGVVVVVALAFARVLGQVQRQRAVGTEQAEAVDRKSVV